ncbi:hypothetical protein GCM10010278_83720 [Streptomyces melanogenes]|nr:hypothetical protein GCM10010278_83720 [Streptomyces melanogenes]
MSTTRRGWLTTGPGGTALPPPLPCPQCERQLTRHQLDQESPALSSTTHPATSTTPTLGQEPALPSAAVPAPTAPTAQRPVNLVGLTARAEAAGWAVTVEAQPRLCLVLTAR